MRKDLIFQLKNNLKFFCFSFLVYRLGLFTFFFKGEVYGFVFVESFVVFSCFFSFRRCLRSLLLMYSGVIIARLRGFFVGQVFVEGLVLGMYLLGRIGVYFLGEEVRGVLSVEWSVERSIVLLGSKGIACVEWGKGKIIFN